jgi:hypothetical protein
MVNCLVEGVMRQMVNRRWKQLQLQLRPWIVCFAVLASTMNLASGANWRDTKAGHIEILLLPCLRTHQSLKNRNW